MVDKSYKNMIESKTLFEQYQILNRIDQKNFLEHYNYVFAVIKSQTDENFLSLSDYNTYTEIELQNIIESIDAKLEPIKYALINHILDKSKSTQTVKTLSFNEKLNKNIVDNPDAAELYSLKAIWGFSIFFSPLFAAVLMSINLKRLNKSTYILSVFLFGITWNILSIYILPFLPQASNIIFLNIIGGMFFLYFFWPKYIGKDLKYRRRNILVPLIIGVGLTILFIINLLNIN